jgi:hypothetical protein
MMIITWLSQIGHDRFLSHYFYLIIHCSQHHSALRILSSSQHRWLLKYDSMAPQPSCMCLGRLFSLLIYTQSVGLHGRGISPSQGRYLHIEQHKYRINAHRNACQEWNSNPRSQCSSGLKRFMPQTARPLWSPNVTMLWRIVRITVEGNPIIMVSFVPPNKACHDIWYICTLCRLLGSKWTYMSLLLLLLFYYSSWKEHIERMDSSRIPNNLYELQTTWEKKPRKTVIKMEWNRNRPLGLILDEEEEGE